MIQYKKSNSDSKLALKKIVQLMWSSLDSFQERTLSEAEARAASLNTGHG